MSWDRAARPRQRSFYPPPEEDWSRHNLRLRGPPPPFFPLYLVPVSEGYWQTLDILPISPARFHIVQAVWPEQHIHPAPVCPAGWQAIDPAFRQFCFVGLLNQLLWTSTGFCRTQVEPCDWWIKSYGNFPPRRSGPTSPA